MRIGYTVDFKLFVDLLDTWRVAYCIRYTVYLSSLSSLIKFDQAIAEALFQSDSSMAN